MTTRSPESDAVIPQPAQLGEAVSEITAVIVSWNTVDLLDECLRSLVAHPADGVTMRAIVVDNGSDDGSVAMLADRWPEVEVIANVDNLGFCRANNQALWATESPWLLLINADAMLTAGSLAALVRRAESDPRSAIVAPRLVYGDGRFQRWTAGAAPSLRSVGTYLFGLDRLSRRIPALAGTYLGHDTDVAFRPDWVSSACMLVRRRAIAEVGGMDERIFVYMDDVDLSQRVRDAGWAVWYEPASTVVHLMGQSTKRRTGRASPEALRAFNRYFAVRHGRRRTAVLRVLQVVGFGARVVAYSAMAVVRPGAHHGSSASAHLSHLRLCMEPLEAQR